MMKDHELKQIILNSVVAAEEIKIEPLTVHEVVEFMKKHYNLKGNKTLDLLKELKYDQLITIQDGCIKYEGYTLFPVVGE